MDKSHGEIKISAEYTNAILETICSRVGDSENSLRKEVRKLSSEVGQLLDALKYIMGEVIPKLGIPVSSLYNYGETSDPGRRDIEFRLILDGFVKGVSLPARHTVGASFDYYFKDKKVEEKNEG